MKLMKNGPSQTRDRKPAKPSRLRPGFGGQADSLLPPDF